MSEKRWAILACTILFFAFALIERFAWLGKSPAFDEPVHLALLSDGATRVAIPSIGFSGVFSQREIQLKPGKYTVVGTRDGYREVRRDITVAPGQGVQTISVSCGEPILGQTQPMSGK